MAVSTHNNADLWLHDEQGSWVRVCQRKIDDKENESNEYEWVLAGSRDAPFGWDSMRRVGGRDV